MSGACGGLAPASLGIAPTGLCHPLCLLRAYECVTKLVPSAEADSLCSTFTFPALTRWANESRRSAAGVAFAPQPVINIGFRNTLLRPGLAH